MILWEALVKNMKFILDGFYGLAMALLKHIRMTTGENSSKIITIL